MSKKDWFKLFLPHIEKLSIILSLSLSKNWKSYPLTKKVNKLNIWKISWTIWKSLQWKFCVTIIWLSIRKFCRPHLKKLYNMEKKGSMKKTKFIEKDLEKW